MPFLVTVRPLRSAGPVFLIVKMSAADAPVLTPPNAMLPEPSVSPVPGGCSTTISGTAGGGKLTPVPVSAMSNGFSFASLLAMESAAVLAPAAPGEKVTSKVVLAPAASVEAPRPPKAKSASCVPFLVTVDKTAQVGGSGVFDRKGERGGRARVDAAKRDAARAIREPGAGWLLDDDLGNGLAAAN